MIDISCRLIIIADAGITAISGYYLDGSLFLPNINYLAATRLAIDLEKGQAVFFLGL